MERAIWFIAGAVFGSPVFALLTGKTTSEFAAWVFCA
tara:strand:+ start:127 stop:237 length:111 start_codon:yes stop_codon:yes gene_type:complete